MKIIWKRLDKSVLESTDCIDGKSMDYCLNFFNFFFAYIEFSSFSNLVIVYWTNHIQENFLIKDLPAILDNVMVRFHIS